MDALIPAIRFSAKPDLCIATPQGRFGGFVPMPFIAMRRATAPGLRYRPRSQSLTWRKRSKQPKTDPARSGWLPKGKAFFIGKQEDGSDLKSRRNSQSWLPEQPLQMEWAAHGSDMWEAQSSS